MRKVSIKQVVGDNCAVISLVLPAIKNFEATEQHTADKVQAIELIETAVKEMRQAVEEINVSAGYLIIDTKTQCRTIASMLTQQMIDNCIKIDKDIDIIRMSDGKGLSDSGEWISLGIYN